MRCALATLTPARRRRCTAASIAAQVEPQPSTSTSASASPLDLGRRDVGGDCRRSSRLAVRSCVRGSRGCSRCCRCRPASRARRRGASARACRGSPTVGRGSRSRRYGQNSSVPSASTWLGSVGERHRDVGERVDVGQLPRLGSVGEVAVAQQDHRCAVLERDPRGLDRSVEAVGRAVRRNDGERRLAVAAVAARG